MNEEINIPELTEEEIERLVEEAHTEVVQQSDTTEDTTEDNIEIEDIITTSSTHDEQAANINKIPENSDSLLVSETTSRFSSAIWYDNIKTKNIIVAGIGGIGSYIVFLLSRMNPNNILVFDPDVVEAVNLSGQLYSTNDIGIRKTAAISRMVSYYSQYMKVDSISQRYENYSTTRDIMICGFDNMEARKTFFNNWYNRIILYSEKEKKNCLFIDGRIKCLITCLYK